MFTPRDAGLLVRMTRPANVAIALATFTVAGYLSYRGSLALWADPWFWAEAGLLVLIMASGYWVNDVYDFRIDRINRPERAWVGAAISTKKVLTVYFGVVFVCAVASALLPLKYLLLNLGALLGLGLYARYLKRTPLWGNLVIASLTAFVVLAGALLHLLRLPLLWMIGFAFLATLVREVVKDAEDLRGDLRYGLKTLPATVGLRATGRWVALGYGLLLLAVWVPAATALARGAAVPWGYLAVVGTTVQLPVVVGLVRLRRAARPTDYRWHSGLLKAILPGGLLALLMLA